jgi:hypothetical protein
VEYLMGFIKELKSLGEVLVLKGIKREKREKIKSKNVDKRR